MRGAGVDVMLLGTHRLSRGSEDRLGGEGELPHGRRKGSKQTRADRQPH